MADIEAFFDYMTIAVSGDQVSRLVETNQRSRQYGLELNRSDAAAILEQRRQALQRCGRIEIGPGTVNKIASAFCSSRYIVQAEYVQTICEIQELLYHIKNETSDLVSDDEIIEIMLNFFEGPARGATGLMSGRYFDDICEEARQRCCQSLLLHDEIE